MSYLPLCTEDNRRFEEEGVVRLVVVKVGGVEDDLLEAGVVPADVDGRSRYKADMFVGRHCCHPLCRGTVTTSVTSVPSKCQSAGMTSFH